MLNKEQTEQALRAAVAERGRGYVYTKPSGATDCRYMHLDGKPGCGVGLVMVRGGISPDVLRLHEGEDGGAVAQELQFADAEGAELLKDFQSWQDLGWTWGESLDRALSEGYNSTLKYHDSEE